MEPRRADEAVSVLLANGDSSLDGTLTNDLAEDYNLRVVGRAVGPREAVDLARTLFPEVVLLDVTDPAAQGIGAGREIRRIVPGTSVVVIADSEARSAIGEGSNTAGYVCAETVSPDVVRLVLQLAALMNRAGP